MAKRINIYSILVAFLATSCMGLNETDPSAYLKPEAGSVEISAENSLYFTLSSSVSSSERIAECGFYYAKSLDMSGAERIEASMGSRDFKAEVLLKDYGSDYYVCSFISNGSEEQTSAQKKISVGPLSDYVTFEESSVDSYVSSTQKAEVSVRFALAKGVEATSCGFRYGNVKDAADVKEVIAENVGDGYFSAVIPSLVVGGPGYYVQPFIKDGEDVVYGKEDNINLYAVPEVETKKVEKITDKSAHIYGEVKSDCGKEISERGFVMAEGNTNPTVDSEKYSVSGKIGEYDLNIEGLKPNTLYSVRAYAVNAEGTAYGKVVNFTTNVALPTVVTETVTNITSSSADINCKISGNGGETPTDCGVLLSTSSDVDPAKSKKVSASSGTSSFTVPVTGLNRKTKYYVQAYVTNSAGTSYGKTLEFETKAELPKVTTAAVTGITDNSAKSGGQITDDGGDSVTARGVVWGKTKGLTIENGSKTSDGTGTGNFTSDITGLTYETKYYVRAYATNSAGTSYGEEVEFTTAEPDLDDAISLADAGTANSYIISGSGLYKFPTVQGNSSTSVGTVASVEVLWESFGTSVTPSVGSLVKNVSYKDGYIQFSTPSTFKEGNAVIAAKNSSGTILWSWHIWLTDKPEEQVYANYAGTMMDRNLGATSATPGDVGALGLLYQWGRKDPFLGSSSISDNVEAKSTGSWPSAVSSSSSIGTISYATKNPMTFITYNESNYDWYYTGDDTTDNTRWQSSKTIYDPCPPGWRVPDGGSNGVWAKAGFDDHAYDDTDEGMLFGSAYSSPSAWYPASSYRGYISGSLGSGGRYGYYWSVTPVGEYAYELYFSGNGYVFASFSNSRAYGQSVRCLKISEMEGDNEGFGSSDYEW